MSERETVRGAVARRQGGGDAETEAVARIESEIRKSRQWFDSVAPKHLDPDQFVSLCLGTIRKGDQSLKRALVQAPWSFMQAASECARLGLVPGETFYFVAFRNQKEQIYEVTGIVAYQGELDMIYRAGGVRSVHCHVVRANDQFVWRPGVMEVPHHVIAREAESHQEGLAGVEERGPLTGVYAFATMVDGGYSMPVVMGASTIAKHRAIAKTDKFWGPPWPDEGPWTEDMWRKTAIHKLFDWVPHSEEYLAERLRTAATVERMPEQIAATQRPAVEAAKPEEKKPLTFSDQPADPADYLPPSDEKQEEEPRRQPDRERSMRRIHAIFRDYGLSGPEQQANRRAVITGLMAEGRPTAFLKFTEMPPDAVIAAADALHQFVTEQSAAGENVGEVLVTYAEAVTAMVEEEQERK